jgi:glycosyltransferase involved in cell wall biosynthesis
MTQLKELSLFLPAYNEEGNITKPIEKWDQVMRTVAEKYKILVVEDGAKDKTAEVVGFKYIQVRVHHYPRTRGKSTGDILALFQK